MIAVVAPHALDAIFSVAELMISRGVHNFTVVSPFMGIPHSDEDRRNYITLNTEHDRACRAMGVNRLDGPLVADDFTEITTWLTRTLPQFDEVWVPIGISNPHHQLVHAAVRHIDLNVRTCMYEELPYRVWNPIGIPFAAQLAEYDPDVLDIKRRLCRMYETHITDDIERCLYVPERLWEPL